MILNIDICDDELIHRHILSNYLDRAFPNKSYKLVKFASEEELLENYPEKLDILLLDIQMVGINGIETAKKIRMLDTNVVIIFTTAIIDFMQQGYEERSFRYLLKPIDSILHRETDSRCVLIHTDTKTYRAKAKINKFEYDLNDKKFYRCHRSYLINLSKVRCISKDSVLIKNNEIVVSRYKIKELRIKITNILGDLL